MLVGLEKVNVVGVLTMTGLMAVPVNVTVALVAPVLANVIVPEEDPAEAGAVNLVKMLCGPTRPLAGVSVVVLPDVTHVEPPFVDI